MKNTKAIHSCLLLGWAFSQGCASGAKDTGAKDDVAPVVETSALKPASAPGSAKGAPAYQFERGFPTSETVDAAYADADLNRAIQAYKFFYPTVSAGALFAKLDSLKLAVNHSAIALSATPKAVVLTANSDTPYAIIPLDLGAGPLVVDLPAGPLICVVNDVNQRYVMDLGLPGPDAGKGGKHLILPPGYRGPVPKGYYTGHSTTNRVLLAVRALPLGGDLAGAFARMRTLKVRPLQAGAKPLELDWQDFSQREVDMSALTIEKQLGYWQLLHQLVDSEPPFEAYRMNYGELAELGIEKGKPFAPDARTQAILEKAAELGNQQMRVQSFANRHPERITWPDRKWEWVGLRSENGTFDLPSHKDLGARERWFFQAVLESPAMFRRDPKTGSLYWLGIHDAGGAYLDGGKAYKLTVPLPVPARLFWSVTVYDTETRSQIKNEQNEAALRSLVELAELGGASSVDLYFGPSAPAGQESRWLQTLPNKGWFAYFRIYGPEAPAFDASWKPGDFQPL